MKKRSLKTRLISSFVAVIGCLGLFLLLLGYFSVNSYVINRTQQEAINDLKIARSVFDGRLKEIGRAFELSAGRTDLKDLKKLLGLDYVEYANSKNSSVSLIAARAFSGRGSGGIRLMDKTELLRHNPRLADLATTKIKETPQARPSQRRELDQVMVMEYALPLLDDQGQTYRVLYGGKVINYDFSLVDEIHDVVFEIQLYNNKPVGTVTIFQDDVRITTNVTDDQGQRAVGTRVSERVYHKVIEQGQPWLNRAFVVTDWYLTGYEPIRDINGRPIGMLYVGILEKPFLLLRRNILLALSLIILLGVGVSAGLAFVLAGRITKPVDRLLIATQHLAGGNLEHRLNSETDLKELNELAESFNEMANQISSRDKSLKALNKSYLDLIGFVTHELKGILATTLLNAYTVRDGYLGIINFKQRRALDAVTRNLDYFDATVKNFLNLSRIEKGEDEEQYRMHRRARRVQPNNRGKTDPAREPDRPDTESPGRREPADHGRKQPAGQCPEIRRQGRAGQTERQTA